TDGSPNCISGRCAKGYAEPQLRYCLRTSVDDWLLPVCRFGALLAGCEPYIRNGLVTPTRGGAIVTWSTRYDASAAKSMSRTCGTAPMLICTTSPPGEACPCACRVGWAEARRTAIVQFSRSWRTLGRLIMSPN